MKDLFTPPLDVVKDVRIRRLPTGIPWFPYTTERDVVWRPLDEIWQQEAQRLTQLPDRYFCYKRRGNSEAQCLHTLDMPDVVKSPVLDEAINNLKRTSAERYNKPATVISAEIAQRGMPVEYDSLPPFGVEEDL